MTGQTSALRETAYAKINLALHVRARQADGYHELETLFAYCDDGDLVSAEIASNLTLAIDGPFADGLSTGEDNLVIRAARALQEAAGVTKGAALHLTKNLPVASGVGGGSSDAAAALRLLNRLWDADADAHLLHAIAADLGADVPACIASQTCFGSGRGDDLETLAPCSLDGMPVLLVNPRVPVETGPVFKGWDGVDRGPLDVTSPLTLDPHWRNDLQSPACAIAPEIESVLEWLSGQDGVTFHRMSGSGATCFALFGSDQACDRVEQAVRRDQPGWWAMASQLR